MSRLPFKTKYLCLLVLFQLVAGPLVLLQVSVFCTLTWKETPREGVAKAMVKAWKSEAFQSLLTPAANSRVQTDHGSLPSNDDSSWPAEIKVHLLGWQSAPALSLPSAVLSDWQAMSSAWTPTWPTAPPGPPPRVG